MMRANLSLGVLFCGIAFGQAPSALPSFEVASIKPGVSGPLSLAQITSGVSHLRVDSAQVDIGSMSLAFLIAYAYRVKEDRVSGPSWMADQRFDIRAKLPAGASKDQVPEMIRALLVERFKLAVHHEERVTPVYGLVVGKKDLKLTKSTNEDPTKSGCQGGFRGQHACVGMSMEDLAETLTLQSRMSSMMPSIGSRGIDRPVVDMTNLKGIYDFTMVYGNMSGSGRGGGGAAPADSDFVSVVDAIQDLGLKLEPRKHPFDTIIIDHLEKVPTEN